MGFFEYGSPGLIEQFFSWHLFASFWSIAGIPERSLAEVGFWPERVFGTRSSGLSRCCTSQIEPTTGDP